MDQPCAVSRTIRYVSSTSCSCHRTYPLSLTDHLNLAIIKAWCKKVRVKEVLKELPPEVLAFRQELKDGWKAETVKLLKLCTSFFAC